MSVFRFAFDTPSVVVPARCAYLLERAFDVGRLRLQVREVDAEFAAVLYGLHSIAMQYSRDPASFCGHLVAPNEDIAGCSRPEGLTVTQIARQYTVTPRHIRREAAAGRLKGEVIAGRWWFSAENVTEWAARRKAP